jgi:hypothetical protein
MPLSAQNDNCETVILNGALAKGRISRGVTNKGRGTTPQVSIAIEILRGVNPLRMTTPQPQPTTHIWACPFVRRIIWEN